MTTGLVRRSLLQGDFLAGRRAILVPVKKNPHAVALGKLGAKAQAESMTLEQRRQWHRLGGLARARKYSRAQRRKWAKLGGRPKLKGRRKP